MIVKILSSGKNFSGIKYNENKVSTGSAGLVAAENFGLLEMDSNSRSIHEYQQFLKAWSTNEKGIIDKPQFHVVISCEGKEKDASELRDIAEQYLQKMGYKENPYLIYFHSDTANNHVHIVSSRVDKNGLKINDSFERRRSQTAIKEVLSQDIGFEMSDQVKKALAYNFSSESQFKMILEGKGVIVKEKEGSYQFIKYGSVNFEISKDLIDKKIKDYQEPEERVKQLRALFIKYKPALVPDKFSKFMKSKFGVDVIFHSAKGEDAPYGYSIIDHAKGQVFKGSQVMKLSALLTIVPREDKLTAGGELIATLVSDDKRRYRDFKNELAKLGFELSPSGEVKIAGEAATSFSMSRERMKNLFYNDRLFEAHKFAINSKVESDIISKVMFVKRDDLIFTGQPQEVGQGAQQIISDKLNSLLATGKNLGDIAKDNYYAYIKKDKEFYLIDKKNHSLYKMADLTDIKLDYSSATVIDADRPSRPEISKSMEYSSGAFGEVADLFLSILETSSVDTESEDRTKKKKRRIE